MICDYKKRLLIAIVMVGDSQMSESEFLQFMAWKVAV